MSTEKDPSALLKCQHEEFPMFRDPDTIDVVKGEYGHLATVNHGVCFKSLVSVESTIITVYPCQI